jgi:GT2 family glycosyltransferase
MKINLSVIIVSWNTRELLRACLASIFAESTGLRMEVFVVDNGSSDGSVEAVRECFPKVQLIENRNNLGFAAANNRVLPLCNGDFVLLLNPDTILKDKALRVLYDFIQSHADAAAVGPKLIHPRVKLDVLGCGRQVTLQTAFNHYFFLARMFPRVRAFEGIHAYVGAHDNEPRQVEWVCGACLLVRRSVISQVGPLDEQWFMYAEDHEWCARMIAAGWKIYHVPDAVVEHHLGASAAQNPATSLLPLKAARDLFIRLNRPGRIQLWLFDVIRTIGLALRSVGYFLQSWMDQMHREMWKAKARLFLDYAIAAARASSNAP